MESSVTIMKYRIHDKYHFKVLDKFDVEDQVERLDAMIGISNQLADKYGSEYEHLWTKETVLF